MRKPRLSDIKQFVPDPKVNATVTLSCITNSPKLKWLKITVNFFPDWWAGWAVSLLTRAAAFLLRVGWAGRSQWLLSPGSQLVLLSLKCLGSPAPDLSLSRSHTSFWSWWSQGDCLRVETARPFDPRKELALAHILMVKTGAKASPDSRGGKDISPFDGRNG